MTSNSKLHAVEAFRYAFGVAPNVAAETPSGGDHGIGVYGWKTPAIDGFELPETDDLIVALHLGGSRQVRAVTDRGLSRTCSMPGLITILPPGRPVAFRTAGSVSLMTLHVPRTSAQNPAFGSTSPDSPPRFAFRDHYVSTSMETLLRAARHESGLRADYIPKLAEALICHLSQSAERTSEHELKQSSLIVAGASNERRIGDSAVRELLDYIDERLSEPLQLNELAERAGLGRAAFTRSFRAATGRSAHQYLTERRIAVATRLLSETDFDLAWIAHETGFSSQSHFTSTFRALTGSTPRRYRDEL